MRRVGSRVASWVVVAAVTAVLSPVSASFAAVANNEVTSVKIKEADGTSGQDTNSGSGVKTGHIQDGAVTDAKISGTIGGSKLGSHGHNSTDLVGIISTSNLPVGATIGSVAAGDHSHDSAYQKKYANVIVVAKSGGDFTDPLTAINSISGASASNPYLVKIMPGEYIVPGNTLRAKSYVDIEGSGSQITRIKSVSGNYTMNYNVVVNSELRNISVINEAQDLEATGIFINDGAPVFSNIDIYATNNGDQYGMKIQSNSKPTLRNVNINIGGLSQLDSGIGIFIYEYSDVLLENVTIRGTNGSKIIAGLNVFASKITATNLKVTGPAAFAMGLHINGVSVSSEAKVYNSVLSGKLQMNGESKLLATGLQYDDGTIPGSNFKCVNCFDSNFNAQ